MKLNKYQKESIVRAIMDDVPKPNVAAVKKEVQEGIVKLMTPAVRKVYKETPEALTKEYYSALYDDKDWNSRFVILGNVTKAQVDVLMEPLNKQNRLRNDTRTRLEGVVKSCSTLKQLKDLLPEFVKYFPTEVEPTKNVPAIANIVTDLNKLGWPKGKAKG